MLTAGGGRRSTLYGTAVVLLFKMDADTAVVKPVLGTTVTNWPATDDVFGSERTVTLPGDRVCPTGAVGLGLITASGGTCDLKPAGRTVTILEGLNEEVLAAVIAGPTIRVG